MNRAAIEDDFEDVPESIWHDLAAELHRWVI